MSDEIENELKVALENIEKSRLKVINQLENLHQNDKKNEKQLHLLVSTKLDLLDIKICLKEVLENIPLIKFDE